MDYQQFKGLLPGTLIDINYEYDNRTDKKKFSGFSVVPNSNKHIIKDIYL